MPQFMREDFKLRHYRWPGARRVDLRPLSAARIGNGGGLVRFPELKMKKGDRRTPVLFYIPFSFPPFALFPPFVGG